MHLLYISPFFVGKNAGLLHRCNLMTKPKKGGLLTVISNQITKFQNNKKLVEFVDKMNPAAPSAYAHLHAGQEELAEGERKIYSLIGVGIADYSQGTGEGKTQYATFNLSPCDVKQITANIAREIDKVFLRSAFSYGYKQNSFLIFAISVFSAWVEEHIKRLFNFLNMNFSFPAPDGSQKENLIFAANKSIDRNAGGALAQDPYSKNKEIVIYTGDKLIAASKDQNGKSPMSRIVIKRCGKDSAGNPRRSPWQIAISNGTAVAVKTGSGGFKAKEDSYKTDKFLFVWLTDDEIEKLFRFVCDYIRVFENTMCYQNIKAGRSELEETRKKKSQER